MATTLNFKDIIDLPEWRPCAVSLNTAIVGTSLCSDMRNTEDRDPRIFQTATTAIVNDYNVKNDGWSLNINPALLTSVAAGSSSEFAPSQGPKGTLAAGATSTSVTLTTALNSAVGVNQLANRGDGRGYKIRIIGNSAGGSGLTEERIIVGNTGGTTPTIYLDSALSFVPAVGDGYQILSGRLYLLGSGAVVAGSWKAKDLASNSMLASLATANLPATISTDSSLVVLDELYVPITNVPGEGFLLGTGDGGVSGRALTATASAAGSITGQAAGGDATVLADEYRNFQIRIVKDVGAPTAVGQRRKITTHTAGPSPVYTVPAWTVTPSATAQYVVENANEILCWTTALATTFTYAWEAIGAQLANTWSTTTYGARSSATGAGVMSFQAFGITPDAQKLNRHSFVFSFRGAATAQLDLLDIAGGANGLWSNSIVYGGSGTLFTTGASGAYDPSSGYFYINSNGLQNFFRFDSETRYLENWAQLRYTQGAATVGAKMAVVLYIDGTTKVPFIYAMRQANSELFSILAQR